MSMEQLRHTALLLEVAACASNDRGFTFESSVMQLHLVPSVVHAMTPGGAPLPNLIKQVTVGWRSAGAPTRVLGSVAAAPLVLTVAEGPGLECFHAHKPNTFRLVFQNSDGSRVGWLTAGAVTVTVLPVRTRGMQDIPAVVCDVIVLEDSQRTVCVAYTGLPRFVSTVRMMATVFGTTYHVLDAAIATACEGVPRAPGRGQVTVRLVSAECFLVDVYPGELVVDFRERLRIQILAQHSTFPSRNPDIDGIYDGTLSIRLICEGKKLLDEETTDTYNFDTVSVIHCLFRPPQ